MKYGHVTLLILGVLALTGATLAQGRKPITLEEKRRMVVSARAGEINLVEGDVSTKSGQDWSLVVPGDTVKSGDIVKTGPGSRAEVLLNPGSYLRLSENTEFKFDNTSIDNVKINLLKGSAIIEAAAGEGSAGVLATVITPKAQFSIVGAGVYRFNVDEAGRTEARVAKGRLATGTIDVREGKEAVITDGSSEVLAFDKKSTDTFDVWSKDRAKSLVAANGNLTRTDVNLQRAGFLVPGGSFFSSPFGPSLWSSRFGFLGSCEGWWYFDPFFGSFIYVPNAFGSCSPFFSPYGFGYQACYYPPVGGGYVEEPGEGTPGKKPGKHPGVPKHPGAPNPAERSLGSHNSSTLGSHHGPTLGMNRGGSLGSGHPTIGHSSSGFSGSRSSGGSFHSTYSGGSGSSSGGHVSSVSSAASSAPVPSAASSGGGHHH